jgi:hypothetical protein
MSRDVARCQGPSRGNPNFPIKREPAHRLSQSQRCIECILQALFIAGFYALQDLAVRIGPNDRGHFISPAWRSQNSISEDRDRVVP